MKQQKPDSKIKRFLKLSGIAALVTGAAILFYGCENDIEKIKAFSPEESLPILEAANFETMYTDSGTVRYLLKTPKLLRFENEGKEYHEFPEGIEIIQYDAKKEVVSSLRSDYAKQFVKEQKWEAKNNVVATNLKGDTLKTEHLIWEEKEKQVHTEEFVEIIREDGIYHGIGLTADETLEKWRIKKLTGVVYVSVDENREKGPSNNIEKPDLTNKKNKPFNSPLQIEEQ